MARKGKVERDTGTKERVKMAGMAITIRIDHQVKAWERDSITCQTIGIALGARRNPTIITLVIGGVRMETKLATVEI